MRTVQGMAPAGARSSHHATGQGGIAQTKWQLLKTIEDIRQPLGLKGTSISLLRAMISFLRVDHIDAARDDGHICFASNSSLAKRAHVSIQTVERHIGKLVSLGLLARRSSGNGKRWARRDRKGSIVLATGLSLLPLAERYPEFLRMAQDHQDLKNELGRLRDMCSAALANLKAKLMPENWDEGLFSRARKLLKRQPNKQALSDLLAEITMEISELTCTEPDDLRDTAPEIEGHKETSKSQYVNKETSFKIEVGQEEMERAYPRLCAELRFAKNQDACHRLMDDIAGYLSLGNTWFAIKDFGPALSFMILGYLLERSETINNHRGYAFKIAQDLSNKTLDWRTLLKRPKSN
ncbi:helix-turn-helix domain-containing protein [Yoonia sp.]|uniref:helix-turn-helix domain-containing protein n=1 Tax=Yoonia sp. TaxID=2212373 RepID=UPI003F4ACF1D